MKEKSPTRRRIGRPPLAVAMAPVGIRLPLDLWNETRAHAFARNEPYQQVVQRALTELLAREHETEPTADQAA